jgi:hypothetical protein
MKKTTIEDCQELAKTKGGKCLSETYVNSKEKMLWECAEGHQWEAPSNSIRRGSWCAKCAGVARLSIDDMRSLAQSRNGKCLSRKYINNQTKLLWQCSNSHKWRATPHDVKGGSWCPVCRGVRALTVDDMRKLAKERNGRCLADEYINSATKIMWECSEGHQWEATPNTIQKGSWCPVCAGRPFVTIEDMRKIAAEKGGDCLSTTYTNDKTKLLWRCRYGHIWESSPNSVKKGRWCQQCKRSIVHYDSPVKSPTQKSFLRISDFEIGRVCIKTKGKDAGRVCVVIDHIDEKHVMIDGLTRRKKCSLTHLERTDIRVAIVNGASHESVIEAING